MSSSIDIQRSLHSSQNYKKCIKAKRALIEPVIPQKSLAKFGKISKDLENNHYAIQASKRFIQLTEDEIRDKLKPWIGDEWDIVSNPATHGMNSYGYHIGEILDSMKAAIKNLKNCKTEEWNAIFCALLGLAQIVMGWKGAKSRNPGMAWLFFELIIEACTKSFCRKEDSGLFTIYLEWALEGLSEPNFSYGAKECLFVSCYQFEPKVVMTSIEELLLNPQKDSLLKVEKRWTPIIQFIGDAVCAFGVGKFYFRRIINVIHKKLEIAKSKESKEACYFALCALYQQLGTEWRDILLLPNASKSVQKALNAKLSAMHNGKIWKQQRWTKEYGHLIVSAYYRDVCGSAALIDDIIFLLIDCTGILRHPNEKRMTFDIYYSPSSDGFSDDSF